MRITRKEFKRRLEAMAPEEPAGGKCRCPLERLFDLEEAGYRSLIKKTGAPQNTPRWACNFMLEVDNLLYDDDADDSFIADDWSTITAAKALEILG